MKKYVVIYLEKITEPTKEIIKDHVEFLKILEKKDYLYLCGPLTDIKKALIILKASSIKEVLNLIHRDPFIQTKIYKSFEISEFLLADKNNHFLLDSPSD